MTKKEKRVSKGFAALRGSGARIIAAVLLAAAITVFFLLPVLADPLQYVVYLDGEEVGIVSCREEILHFVAGLHEKEARNTGLEVRMSQEVRVEKERRRGEAGDREVRDKLGQSIRFNVYAYVVVVNDQPVLAVSSLEDYETALTELKSFSASVRENTVVREIVLKDKVEAVWTTINPGQLYSAGAAAEMLVQGTGRSETYLVSRGDSLWSIAHRNNMTVEELKQANPHLKDTDLLQVGDKLQLMVAEPLVSVVIVEEMTIIEPIPFKTAYRDDGNMYQGTNRVVTAGQPGSKKVVYRIASENGRETGREVVSETVVREPGTQVVARGTAIAPVTGSGKFVWPVAGGGRIMSPFGPRGRVFHYGVDIAAPAGTMVLAADDGVVTCSGWSGSYGILVAIDHGNGYVTRYAHNSATLVSMGNRVQKGRHIARVGSTGNSTGPHLHFEILRDGTHLNPLSFF